MRYELAFGESALKEWNKLDNSIKVQFKKKLIERLKNPNVAASKLHGSNNRYKIKLRSLGYRLVYEVEDAILTVTVIAIGKRERSEVYKLASDR